MNLAASSGVMVSCAKAVDRNPNRNTIMSSNLNLFIYASSNWRAIKRKSNAGEPDAESILQSHFGFARIFFGLWIKVKDAMLALYCFNHT